LTSPTAKRIITVITEKTLSMRLVISTTLIGRLITLIVGGCDQFSPESRKAKHLELGQTYFDRGAI